MLSTNVTFDLNDGRKIPALGLGTVPSGNPNDVKDQVIAAVKAGYRHIDTAYHYKTEPAIGAALKELFETGVVKREDLFITTKVWPTHHNRVEESIDKSLSDLGIEYADLVLQHWPLCFDSTGKYEKEPGQPRDENGKLMYDDDPKNGTKYLEFYQNLEKVYQTTNKIKSLGVSNYTIGRLEKLLPIAKVKPVVNQIEYHPQLPQQDLVDFCKKEQIIITAYSAFGSNGAGVLKIPLVKELAKKYEVTENEIAIAYHILNGRCVLPRSSNLERIKTIIRLPPITEEELDQLYKYGEEHPKRYITDEWGTHLGFKWWP